MREMIVPKYLFIFILIFFLNCARTYKVNLENVPRKDVVTLKTIMWDALIFESFYYKPIILVVDDTILLSNDKLLNEHIQDQTVKLPPGTHKVAFCLCVKTVQKVSDQAILTEYYLSELPKYLSFDMEHGKSYLIFCSLDSSLSKKIAKGNTKGITINETKEILREELLKNPNSWHIFLHEI